MVTEYLEVLMRHRERFLGFLERRLGSRAEAEDLLQSALLKTIVTGEGPRAEANLLPWFYETMRNLVIDHHRRRAAVERVRQRVAREGASLTGWQADLPRRTCPCVRDVVDTLKPSYAGLICRVDLDGEPLRHVASDLSIEPNNASVRLHRARRALRQALQARCGACAGAGCFDCTCPRDPGATSSRPGAWDGLAVPSVRALRSL